MITIKQLTDAIPDLLVVEAEEIAKKLNANFPQTEKPNPALDFEMALHKLLGEYLQTGLTIVEAVGALECVKAHLFYQFHKNQ